MRALRHWNPGHLGAESVGRALGAPGVHNRPAHDRVGRIHEPWVCGRHGGLHGGSGHAEVVTSCRIRGHHRDEQNERREGQRPSAHPAVGAGPDGEPEGHGQRSERGRFRPTL